MIIPQADLKPTEIIRQQINSASRTGRRSSKDYRTRPKSTHYSTEGKIFTNNQPGFKTDFPGHSLGTSTNPGDYRFLEKSIQGSNMVLSGTQISLNDRQNLWKSSAKMNLNSPRTTKTFLRARTTLGPEDKYEYPFVSSFNYGWRLNDHIKEYKVNIKQSIKLYKKGYNLKYKDYINHRFQDFCLASRSWKESADSVNLLPR